MKRNRWIAGQFSITLVLTVLAVTALRIVLIPLQAWPINGDEAQYWNWSQHLAWGYYSKPPFLAWMIALTTQLFGNGVIGLRIGSSLCHGLTALLIFYAGSRLYDERIGFWASLAAFLGPAVTYSANFISTDPLLLVFWSLSFCILLRALEENRWWLWLALGLVMGFGIMSKYTAVLFPISALLYFIFVREHHEQLNKPFFYVALLVTLIVLAPNLMWNIQHGFASVLAVDHEAHIRGAVFHPRQLLAFWASQLIILGPIFGVVLFYLLLRWRKVTQDPRLALLLWFVLPLFLLISLEALLHKANANWAAPIYATASIAVAAYLIQRQRMVWVLAAILLNVVMMWLIYNPAIVTRTVGIHYSRTMTSYGWLEVGKKIQHFQQAHPGSLLLSDGRRLLAKTMYFSHIPLRDSYKWDPSHRIAGQYDMVTDLSTQQHKDFIYVTYAAHPVSILSQFQHTELLDAMQLASVDGRTLPLYIYYAQDFQGYKKRS